MSEQPPAPVPPTQDVPPVDTPPPAPPTPVPPAPEKGASDEVLAAVQGLTEIVTKLVNKDAGLPDDHTPVKVPWIYRGGR